MTQRKPDIRTIAEKKLIGMRLPMSIMNDRTSQLWRSFMPRQKEITHRLDNFLYSIRTYAEPMRLLPFDAAQAFDKWAAVEVSDSARVPDGFERLQLPAGQYAVFHYRGSSSDTRIFQFIFGQWLPDSPYALDHRPQFEVLGEKYSNNNPDSEEEIWIPITMRSR